MTTEHRARLLKVRDLSPTTKHFLLEALGEERFEFLPGQFVSFLLPIPVPDPTRSYSMASPPEGTNRFELCLNRIQGGPGSAFLFGLEPGAEVPFTGPWGAFAMRRMSEAPKAFIATGTGIAPIRSQIRWLFKQGFSGEAWLLFGARNEQEILYCEEWEALAREHQNSFSFPRSPGQMYPGRATGATSRFSWRSASKAARTWSITYAEGERWSIFIIMV